MISLKPAPPLPPPVILLEEEEEEEGEEVLEAALPPLKLPTPKVRVPPFRISALPPVSDRAPWRKP